jgi:hypothetical protein
MVSPGYADVTLTGHGTKGIKWVRVQYTQIAPPPPTHTIFTDVSSFNEALGPGKCNGKEVLKEPRLWIQYHTTYIYSRHFI